MSHWGESDLRCIGAATELEITSRRTDGILRPYVTIGGVRVGDELYIRSAHGADNPWLRRAAAAGAGRVRAAGLERDITFSTPNVGVHTAIDAAYHAKYDRYEPQIVGDQAAEVTLRLDPQR